MKQLTRIAATLASVAIGMAAPSGAAAEQGAGAAPAAEAQRLGAELAGLRQEFEAIRQQYNDRLAALEQRLQQLGAGTGTDATVTSATPQATATPTPTTATAQGETAMPPGGGRVFNPDTSVIGNMVGLAGRNATSEDPALQLTEAEVAFQAVVDPYARGDFYLAAGPDGLEIEEGYATFTSLPANFLVKAGKLRAQFGKVNTLHTHAMPTVDRPLVTTNLVGGEEGLSDGGISVSHLIDNPYLFLEATGEVFGGRSDVFHGTGRSQLTYLGRLRGYRDLSEDKNLDFGVSYAFGSNAVAPDDGPLAVDNPRRQLVGADLTFRYRPLRRAIYQRLNLRTELIWSRQDLARDVRASAFGFYGLGEYQFARRWYVGARIDRSGRLFDGAQRDNGGSVFVTFWPTEFSQLRGQFRRTNFAEGTTANEALFQLNFAIGAHGAHVF